MVALWVCYFACVLYGLFNSSDGFTLSFKGCFLVVIRLAGVLIYYVACELALVCVCYLIGFFWLGVAF